MDGEVQFRRRVEVDLPGYIESLQISLLYSSPFVSDGCRSVLTGVEKSFRITFSKLDFIAVEARNVYDVII
ncbi:MAG: hypothetical protein PHG47_01365 [Sulfuricella sp.]|nr:hypothetical protein [Sulfuricella sp.]